MNIRIYRLKFFALYVLISMYSTVALAQTISVQAPKIAEKGEYVHITYTIDTEPGDNFTLSTVDALQLAGRPYTSTSNSISIVNGVTTSNYKFSTQYQFRAVKEGVFKIPEASVIIKGKKYASKPQDIEIVASSQSSSAQRYGQSQQQAQSATKEREPAPTVSDKEIFAQVYTNKKTVYVGEPIYVSIKLFTQKNFSINEHTYPEFVGFYKKIIEQATELKFEKEVVNGKEYYSVLFQRLVVFPQKSGTLTITPFKVDCNVITQVGNSFWNMRNISERKVVATNPIPINVLPLPAGKSKDFTGAVGEFTMQAQTDVQTVKANEAIVYTLSLQGLGNLALLTPPALQLPDNFEVYDPKIKESYTTTTKGDKGKKVYEYVIIPRYDGEFTIPAVQFQYFNPATKSYSTLSTKEISITVEKSDVAHNSGTTVQYSATKEKVNYSADDFRYIYSQNASLKTPYYIVRAVWYYMFLFALIVATSISIIIWRKRIKLYANKELLQQKKAAKTSKKILKQASEALADNRDADFYDAISKAVFSYVSNKFMISTIDFTTDALEQVLGEHAIKHATIAECKQILATCDMARFAPSLVTAKKEEVLAQTIALIHTIEQSV